ncbi:hypothetical protein Tco_0148663 [Tanacetum coccineum]
MEGPQFSSRIHSSINAITICPKQPNKSGDNKSEEEEEEKGKPKNIDINPPSPPDPTISLIIEKVCKLNSFLESFNLVPQSPDTKFVCTKEDDEDVIFIDIIEKYNDSRKEELEEDENTMAREIGVEYFDIFSIRS